MSAPATVARGRTLAELAPLAAAASGREPGWLEAARRGAADWIAQSGFPDRHHEDWRYVDLRPLLGLPLTPLAADSSMAAPELAALLDPGLGGPRLVMVNGRFVAQLSDLGGLPPGTQVLPLCDAITDAPAMARRHWPAPGHAYLHAFDALNAALAVDGCVVQVGEGATLDAPIEILHLSSPAHEAVVSSPRIVIMAGAGSSATIVETYMGAARDVYVTNAHTSVMLAPGARLEHYKLQDESDRAFHLSTLDVTPGENSHFRSGLVAVGSGLGRHEIRVRMTQQGATVDLQGLYLPTGDQCHDNPVMVEHIAPRCASHQLYKGIVDGAAHGIFNGHVIVHPGAAGTDAEQTNKNLLLSDRAEVDTRPRLEIFADDVSCTHGAAVGQLDPDALFYLRSRGIPEPAARALLISGFAQQVLEHFRPGATRGRADHLVTAHLDGRGYGSTHPGESR